MLWIFLNTKCVSVYWNSFGLTDPLKGSQRTSKGYFWELLLEHNLVSNKHLSVFFLFLPLSLLDMVFQFLSSFQSTMPMLVIFTMTWSVVILFKQFACISGWALRFLSYLFAPPLHLASVSRVSTLTACPNTTEHSSHFSNMYQSILTGLGLELTIWSQGLLTIHLSLCIAILKISWSLSRRISVAFQSILSSSLVPAALRNL